jgi:hypothetical protein
LSQSAHQHRDGIVFQKKSFFYPGSILAMVMPSKPPPTIQKMYMVDADNDEVEDVVFSLPPTASRNTRRFAIYLQKELHFPELLLMLIFMVSCPALHL